MQAREKILAGLLGGAVASYAALPLFESTVLAPLTERDQRIETLTQDVESATTRKAALLRASREVGRAKSISLPADQHVAHRVYQEWLLDLCQVCGFADVKLTLPRRAEETAYVTLPVQIDASATMKELGMFLYHFNRAELLQKLKRVDVVSPSSDGNPRLGLVIEAEALTVAGAVDRETIFPTTTTQKPVTKTATQITPATSEGFPSQGPFTVLAGSELIDVTGIEDGNWVVRRGAVETTPVDLPAGSEAVLFPAKADVSLGSLAALWKSSPFVLPVPPSNRPPRLTVPDDKAVLVGETWKDRLKADGFTSSDGPVEFKLVSPEKLEGWSLDPRSGEIVFAPTAGATLGERQLTFEARAPQNPSRVAVGKTTLLVKAANRAPKFGEFKTVTAYLGREKKVKLECVDEDGHKIEFSLAAAAPPGLVLDATTGELTINPPLEAEPADHTLTVKAKDEGDPPLTSELPISIRYEDDVAAETYLIAAINRGDDWSAWLYDRINNKRTEVRVGDEFECSELKAKVTGITLDKITLQTEAGNFVLPLEKSLRQLSEDKTVVPEADKTETSPSAKPAVPAAG